MKKILFLPFILITILVAGCSSVSSQRFGNKQLESLKTAYVVVAPRGNTTISGYIQTALSHHGVQVSAGKIEDKPKDVGFFVTYRERWDWDVAVYLEYLDIEFVDNTTAQVFASGAFRNTLLHTFPDPRTKTFEVIDSIYAAK